MKIFIILGNLEVNSSAVLGAALGQLEAETWLSDYKTKVEQWFFYVKEKRCAPAGKYRTKYDAYEIVETSIADAYNPEESVDLFLAEQLRLWKETPVPTPARNELQSIHAWLGYLTEHGTEKTLQTMRARMTLLLETVNQISEGGLELEDKLGLYADCPRDSL